MMNPNQIDSRSWNTTVASEALVTVEKATSTDYVDFKALQYALFATIFIEVLGGIFFLINSFFIVEDRQKVDMAVKGEQYVCNHLLCFQFWFLVTNA